MKPSDQSQATCYLWIEFKFDYISAFLREKKKEKERERERENKAHREAERRRQGKEANDRQLSYDKNRSAAQIFLGICLLRASGLYRGY